MMALRRLMIGIWGPEAGMRIRVIHPVKPATEQIETTSITEHAAAERAMLKQIDQRRSAATGMWYGLNGH